MDYLLRCASALLSHAASRFEPPALLHDDHIDLDVASSELDHLCLFQNVMHIRHCEN